MSNELSNISSKFIFTNKPFLIILIITIAAFLVRIYVTNWDASLSNDALNYFLFAQEISYLQSLPNDHSLSNLGWPIFLSIFFSIFDYDHIISNMQLQKLLSIILSVAVITPVYFFCKKFTKFPISLVGVIIFAFDPRLIENSTFGITEPLYMLLGISALVLILNFSKILNFISFGMIALTTIVRSEGIFLFIIISILYFFNKKIRKKDFVFFIFSIMFFILILLPILDHQNEVLGHDGIFGRISYNIEYHTQSPENTAGNSGIPFIIKGLENYPKYLGWNLIPIFIFFVPIGTYFMLKKWKREYVSLPIIFLIMSIPAFFAYSIPVKDTRYLFMIFPIFCVLANMVTDKIIQRFNRQNLIIGIMIIVIIISSMAFLTYQLDKRIL